MKLTHPVEEHQPVEAPKRAAPAKAAEEPKLAEEIQKMEYEPLLPIEKKLVLWSVLLGLFLLAVLFGISRTFFHG